LIIWLRPKTNIFIIYNGVNFRLIQLINENGEWKISSVTDAPLESMSHIFNNEDEKIALKIIQNRYKGRIINKSEKLLSENKEISVQNSTTKIESSSSISTLALAVTASDNVQPSTIRVRRVSLGRTDTVSFLPYVKDVLPNEWGPSWNYESLKAGAMACKTFGWYCVLHPLKPEYSADLTDNESAGQLYIPGSRNNSSSTNTNLAVDSINGQVIQGTRTSGTGLPVFYVFYAEYRRGTSGSLNSNYYHTGIMAQYGTKYMGDNELANWYEMCQYYYDNASSSNYPWRSIGPIVIAYY